MATVRQQKEIATSWNAAGGVKSKSVKYLVEGASDENSARASVGDAASSVLDGRLKLAGYELDEYHGGNTWTISAEYEEMTDAELAELNDTTPAPSYSFDTSGGSANMKKGLWTVWKSEGAMEVNGGINWDGTQFNGVDIVAPNLVESYTLSLKKSRFTAQYKRRLAVYTGCVNLTAFKGWERGEVLFLGASASSNGDKDSDYIELTFKFAIALNATDIDMGGTGAIIPEKYGWHYAWAIWENSKDSPVFSKPTSVYVNRVYVEMDFAALGLGK